MPQCTYVFILHSLCEVHETHVKVGSNGEAQEQLICIAHSSDYDTWNAQVVLNLMVCLAHATEVHPNLASNSIVGGIVDICALRQKVSDCGANELMLLRSATNFPLYPGLTILLFL